MSERKILFFGPYSAPVTGQSVAFSLVYDNFISSSKILIDTTKFSSYRVFNTLVVLLRIIQAVLFFKTKTVYFTCSRSWSGFLKDFFLLLFFRWSNVKVINHLHGADFQDFFYSSIVLRKLISWSYQPIDIYIVLLEKMKEQFGMFLNAEIRVVSNCYTSGFYDLKFRKLDKVRIVYFSNIMESKGIMDFLSVSELLLEKNKELDISISGLPLSDEFSSKKRIEKVFSKRIDQLKNKFGNRINYWGLLQGNDKIELLQNSSVFVLPSYYKSEAVPLSVLEAMRAGNAIVATDHNYLSEFLNERNGLLVKPKLHDLLFEAILKLCENKELLESKRVYNFESSKKLYSTNKYVDSIKKIINFE